ncbi:MAG TPA: oxidoreductase, partial [Spirochaetota bacterium]|nr:oxidoreductase [Spirochaetota bacterium]
GITLFGIDSQNCPMDRRTRTWNMLAGNWKFPWLGKLASEVALDGVVSQIERIRAGKHHGRIIVNIQD